MSGRRTSEQRIAARTARSERELKRRADAERKRQEFEKHRDELRAKRAAEGPPIPGAIINFAREVLK